MGYGEVTPNPTGRVRFHSTDWSEGVGTEPVSWTPPPTTLPFPLGRRPPRGSSRGCPTHGAPRRDHPKGYGLPRVVIHRLIFVVLSDVNFPFVKDKLVVTAVKKDVNLVQVKPRSDPRCLMTSSTSRKTTIRHRERRHPLKSDRSKGVVQRN